MTWAQVEAALPEAKSIAFDGCHKIYVLMDDEQTAQMEEWGYGKDDDGSFLVKRTEIEDNETLLNTLRDWWSESCMLRFISAVRTVKGDPNKGFTDLISQTEDEE